MKMLSKEKFKKKVRATYIDGEECGRQGELRLECITNFCEYSQYYDNNEGKTLLQYIEQFTDYYYPIYVADFKVDRKGD